jgi:hypothetical protein
MRRAAVRRAAIPIRPEAAPDPALRRTIPFDYAFRYELTGAPGKVLNSTVTVSIEAAFVAVAIGYGVVPKVTPISFGPALPTLGVTVPPSIPSLRDVTLGALIDGLAKALPETSRLLRRETGPEAVLKNGFKLNPAIVERALLRAGTAPLDPSLLARLFQVVAAPPEQIQFKYAMFDDGSGREFQSEPILNTAGLGIASGDRPFRPFAPPILFAPRSTVRMQVTEVSDFQGELHVTLQGYKVLGEPGTPTGRRQR